jgi:pimeloyl-ACP methyl ester carboxylesterase
MWKIRFVLLAGLMSAIGMLSTGCSVPPNGPLSSVQPLSDRARVGNVYLLRGWIGVFSTGMDALTDKINAAGVRAIVYQDTQWSELADAIKDKYSKARYHEPIVLVGHSYGADDVLRMAEELDKAGIAVDLVVTLDAVTPPRVPGNVRLCYNLYQSNPVMDHLPFLRGIPVKSDSEHPTKVINNDIRVNRTDLLEPGLDHFNIEKKPKIHDDILRQILAVCPPRRGWVPMARPRAVPTSTPKP